MRQRGGIKPEQFIADTVYDILQELKKLNKNLEESKKKWLKK
jgi:hypothetical protein